MKDWMKVFLALAAIIGGAVLLRWTQFGFVGDDWFVTVVSVLMIAGGVTYFWMDWIVYWLDGRSHRR